MHFGHPNLRQNCQNTEESVKCQRSGRNIQGCKEPSYPSVYQTGGHEINVTFMYLFLNYHLHEMSGRNRNVQ